jgi:general secretion pathway protein G
VDGLKERIGMRVSMRSRGWRRQRGFTLIELLVVLVILAIVVSIGIVALMNALDKSRQRATMADMRTISKGIEIYSVDHGHLPSDGGGITGLQAVLTPYESSVIPANDAWGHLYSYSRDDLGNYTLASFGKDGVAGAAITVATRDDFERDIVLVNGQFVAAPQ